MADLRPIPGLAKMNFVCFILPVGLIVETFMRPLCGECPNAHAEEQIITHSAHVFGSWVVDKF